MKKLSVCGVILLCCLGTFAQDYLAKNEYFYSLTNRLDLMVVSDESAKEISLGIVFQCGSFTERDAYHGLSFIYERIINVKLKQQLSQIIPDTTAFNIISETTFEYVTFRLIFPKSHLERVLRTINQIVTAPFSMNEIKEAADYSNSEYQSRSLDPSFSLAEKIGINLWENDYKKRMVINTWNDSTTAIIPQKMTSIRSKYFCPGNGFIAIKGDVAPKDIYEMAKVVFEKWDKCTINPFTRFPSPNYRLILKSRQLVDENALTEIPFFRIAFPGPNTFEDKRSNYCALVLSANILSPDSKIHHLMQDSCRLASASVHNDLAKYISQITFEFTAQDSNAALGYECFRSLLMNMNDSILNDEELSLGKELVISNFKNQQSDNGEHISQIIKFWSSISLNDYNTFEDSIRSITPNDMMVLFDKYFHERHYVAGLSINPVMRLSLHIDSAFTNTPDDIKQYRIHFMKNTARFSRTKDDSTLTSLIQFLKTNPDMAIKVNGVCHKDELLKVNDKAMIGWLNSLEHKITNPPSLVKKKTLRLDIYRSLTIIKKLADAGIDTKRLFGTGFLVRSPGETEKYQYAHFTEVLN